MEKRRNGEDEEANGRLKMSVEDCYEEHDDLLWKRDHSGLPH